VLEIIFKNEKRPPADDGLSSQREGISYWDCSNNTAL
jgi:hypothetical protein